MDLPGHSSVLSRLQAARERLDARDLPAAVEIYEDVLAEAGGERADVLVMISGDLGSTGHAVHLIELIAPRYDVVRHGPATGLNVLQAYLALRDAESAQHMLGLLFSLKRPDLEDRLFGFSNAIAELLLQDDAPSAATVAETPDGIPPPSSQAATVALVSISKPIWFYGLEPLASQVLPSAASRPRRIAFSQLALPSGYPDFGAAMDLPEDELGRLARGLPTWLAETFFFSARYESLLVMPFVDQPGRVRRPFLFGTEWTVENLRQMADTTEGGIDYAVTGALRHRAGDYELILRVWELKKFRERKQFIARWTPATANAELAQLREALGNFMEWTPAAGGVDSHVPEPRSWLDVVGSSLLLFLAEKGFVAQELLPSAEALAAEAARLAPTSALASLAWLTLARRCRSLGLTLPQQPAALFESPVVKEAERLG